MEKMRRYAKSVPITFESWSVSFIGIILIRALFEQFSSYKPGEFNLVDASAIIHQIAFFIVTIVVIIIILLYYGKTNLKEVSVISIFGLFVVLISPIVDLVTGGVGGHPMGYIFAPGKELLTGFLTFFGGDIRGSTLGIRVETILGIIFCYLYVFSSTKKITRAVSAAVTFYCFIYFMASIPSLFVLFTTQQDNVSISVRHTIMASHILQNNVNPGYTQINSGLYGLAFDKAMIGFHTILVTLFSTILFYLTARKKLIALVKNSRSERIFHFYLLFLFGTSLVHERLFVNLIDVQSYILALIAITAACMYSVCQNDIYDKAIDTISNPNRPLIVKDLSKNDMKIASKILLIIAFVAAYASGGYILFFTGLFILIYYIYSNPPLRLKRIVLLNSSLVGLACLSVIMAGFFISSSNKSITAFPFGLLVAILIFFSTVTNVRDLKDVEGDGAEGIKTIPVLLGLKRSKKLIAGIICIFFLLIPWYFQISFLIIPSIIVTILSWYFITQDNYKEWKGFFVYMAYLIIIIGTNFLK